MLTKIGLAIVGLMLVTSAAWATFGYYSAIAMDPVSGVYGWSTGWLFQNQAEGDALRRCRSNANGSHCRGVLVFNSCGAVTTGTNGSYFGVGLTPDLAESRAKNACGQDGNRNCKIIISFCSAEGEAPAPGVPTPHSTTPSSPPPCQQLPLYQRYGSGCRF